MLIECDIIQELSCYFQPQHASLKRLYYSVGPFLSSDSEFCSILLSSGCLFPASIEKEALKQALFCSEGSLRRGLAESGVSPRTLIVSKPKQPCFFDVFTSRKQIY